MRLALDLMKTGNFSQTARRHYRTQPAVSISIRKLENELGLRLFERSGRRVRLTSQGEQLKDDLAGILKSIEDFKFNASLLEKNPAGEVHFGTIRSIGLYELGPVIKKFIKKYKEIRLKIQYDEAALIYAAVEKKEIDFGIVAYPAATKTIEVLAFTANPMVIIAPPDTPLRRSKISFKELNGMKFVAFSQGIPTRQAIDRIFHRTGVTVDISFEDSNIETLKKAVEVGMGVSILPLQSVEREYQNGQLRVIRFKEFTLKRPIGIIRLKRYPLRKSAELFLRELLAVR